MKAKYEMIKDGKVLEKGTVEGHIECRGLSKIKIFVPDKPMAIIEGSEVFYTFTYPPKDMKLL
jgi:hypothetical protein